MSQNRAGMPSSKLILKYWNDKYDNEFTEGICWGCGIHTSLERCHIEDRYLNLNDNLDNLVLLCRRCHKDQELVCHNEEGRTIFIKGILEGLIFLNFRLTEARLKYESGLFDHLNLWK